MSIPLQSFDDIRSASRTITQELDVMPPALAAASYPASAVHALLEIDVQGAASSAQLMNALGLDESSLGKVLSELAAAGAIAEAAMQDDARLKQVTLTKQGKALVEEIHAFDRGKISTAMEHLSPSQQQAVTQGLSEYARALKACREAASERTETSVQIVAGYRPGLIGRIAEMHALFYSNHHGFGRTFESQIAAAIAEFAGRLDEPHNRVWTAVRHGRIIGSIAVDGQDLDNKRARLRWFILDDGYRGKGIGRTLIEKALDFCDHFGFTETQLWTFKGLDAARKLYESAGFALVHEKDSQQWGSPVTEQQFIRARTNSSHMGSKTDLRRQR